MSNSILSLPEDENSDFLGSLAEEFRASFAELQESAEKEFAGSRFVFNRYGKELYPYFEDAEDSPAPGCIFPIKEGRPVASVDSTCVLVGETSRGALYAARTAVGVSMEGSLRRFFRLGPILVYASSSGLRGIKGRLTRSEVSMVLSDHALAERVIRNLVERKVVDTLMESEEETIVMADGSLRHPMGQFGGGTADFHGKNCLVGFSKSSNLIMSEGAVCSLSRAETPSFAMVDDGPVKTVLAKFSHDGLVFRLDLGGAREPVQTTLGRILWNDAFASGYPDSLKIAHHLSVFSKAEDQALKAFVTKKFRLRQLPTFSLRRIALGSFRGGA